MAMSVMKMEMVLASSYIPKGNPEKPLGEDAHFLCEAEQAFGVADGVGGWSRRGIDSGVYARALMLNSAAAVESSPADAMINPMAVLAEAYASTKAEGSSTACIATLHGDMLRIANVGDSGVWIFRDNRCVFVSPTQQSRLNCPYQLGLSPGCHTPTSAVPVKVRVCDGDMVVCGTDGLLDNVYPREIEELMEEIDQTGLQPLTMAHLISNMAFRNSRNECFVSPFETNADKAGCHKFTGGKADDITVIVAFINSLDDDDDEDLIILD